MTFIWTTLAVLVACAGITYRRRMRGQLRRDTPALRQLDLGAVDTHADDAKRVLLMRRGSGVEQVLIAFNFNESAQSVEMPWAGASWRALIETGASVAGSTVTVPPHSFALWSAAPE